MGPDLGIIIVLAAIVVAVLAIAALTGGNRPGQGGVR